jgi:hypothetical protein
VSGEAEMSFDALFDQSVVKMLSKFIDRVCDTEVRDSHDRTQSINKGASIAKFQELF